MKKYLAWSVLFIILSIITGYILLQNFNGKNVWLESSNCQNIQEYTIGLNCRKYSIDEYIRKDEWFPYVEWELILLLKIDENGRESEEDFDKVNSFINKNGYQIVEMSEWASLFIQTWIQSGSTLEKMANEIQSTFNIWAGKNIRIP